MRQLHVAPFQLPHQLHVVISGNAKRCSLINHSHHEPQHFGYLGSAIYQIADEDSPSTLRWNCLSGLRFFVHAISKLTKQSGELLIAPVNVPDDVEWPVLVFLVVPKRLSRDCSRGNFLRRTQNEHVTESFPF